MSFRRKPESIQLGLDARFRGHDKSFFILNVQSSPLPLPKNLQNLVRQSRINHQTNTRAMNAVTPPMRTAYNVIWFPFLLSFFFENSSATLCVSPTEPKLKTPMRANPAQKWKYACKKPEADVAAGKKTNNRHHGLTLVNTSASSNATEIARETQPRFRRRAISSGPILHTPGTYSI
jgi:hypothetical protein